MLLTFLKFHCQGVSAASNVRQRTMLTGLDMEQHSQTFGLPPADISVPSFEPYDNNNSMLHGLQHSHHHQRPSNFGPAMSTPPTFPSPLCAFSCATVCSWSHHPAPPPHLPPTVYPHLDSASYTVPLTIHDASYSHVGPVQSTGFRVNQHPLDDFVPALRHHGLPRFRAFPTDELLALSDHIGTVKTGISGEDVEGLLKRRTSLWTRINLEEAPSTDLETDSCTICQENYKNQDKVAALDCRHQYHAECLKKWLVIKNICPVCKSEALVMEKKK
ncbi:hypothetical protein F2Q70_00023398 [Brassica cretica]|uniref:RING-type E3 ubiquitin transferase n=1 Tax=Brassica cretica TaxID=69181 RepID=A0A8S9GQQ1_BRACR|nr:hypothetical protein F2Q70_00023398 [Brassica cretica]